MKLHTRTNSVEMDGVGRTGSFEIRASGKAFEILSSGIYSDPILAIIRELSSNAWDAHKAAGKGDTPFTIHLPTALEPWFSVTDDGIGLSEDEVFGLYTTYFDSTKSDSNDYIGALGLGSKSPFSYARAFEVTSRFNGKKTLYSIYINDNGIPAVSKMAELDHVGPNGLEVKLSVEQKNFRDFSDKARESLRFFHPRPKFTGNAITFDEIPSHAIRSDDYIVWSADWRDRSLGHMFTAVQGNVQYRVDTDKLGRLLDEGEKSFIRNYKVIGFFEIGQLEVAASREEIRYDKETVSNLIKMIKRIRTDFLSQLDDTLDNAIKTKKSRYKAYQILNEWVGRKLNEFPDIAKGYKFKNDIITQWVLDRGKVGVFEDYRSSKRVAPVTYDLVHLEKGYGKKSIVSSGRGSFQPTDRKLLVIDVRAGYSARVEEYFDNKRISKCYAIKPVAPWQVRKKNTQLTTDKKALEKIYNDDLKKMIEVLGNPEVEFLSNVSNAPKKSSGKKRSGLIVKTWDDSYNSETVHPKWLDGGEFESDPNETYYYIPIDLFGKVYNAKGEVLDNLSHRVLHRFFTSMTSLIRADKNIELYHDDDGSEECHRVYGLTKKSQKMVAEMDNWINLFDAVNEIASKYQYVIDYEGRVQASNIDGDDVRSWIGVSLGYNVSIVDVHRLAEFGKILDQLSDDSFFKKSLSVPYNTLQKMRTQNVGTQMMDSVWSALYHYFDDKCSLKKKDNKPFFDREKFVKKYALVLALDKGLIGTEAGRKLYVQAIQSCDV